MKNKNFDNQLNQSSISKPNNVIHLSIENTLNSFGKVLHWQYFIDNFKNNIGVSLINLQRTKNNNDRKKQSNDIWRLYLSIEKYKSQRLECRLIYKILNSQDQYQLNDVTKQQSIMRYLIMKYSFLDKIDDPEMIVNLDFSLLNLNVSNNNSSSLANFLSNGINQYVNETIPFDTTSFIDILSNNQMNLTDYISILIQNVFNEFLADKDQDLAIKRLQFREFNKNINKNSQSKKLNLSHSFIDSNLDMKKQNKFAPIKSFENSRNESNIKQLSTKDSKSKFEIDTNHKVNQINTNINNIRFQNNSSHDNNQLDKNSSYKNNLSNNNSDNKMNNIRLNLNKQQNETTNDKIDEIFDCDDIKPMEQSVELQDSHNGSGNHIEIISKIKIEENSKSKNKNIFKIDSDKKVFNQDISIHKDSDKSDNITENDFVTDNKISQNTLNSKLSDNSNKNDINDIIIDSLKINQINDQVQENINKNKKPHLINQEQSRVNKINENQKNNYMQQNESINTIDCLKVNTLTQIQSNTSQNESNISKLKETIDSLVQLACELNGQSDDMISQDKTHKSNLIKFIEELGKQEAFPYKQYIEDRLTQFVKLSHFNNIGLIKTNSISVSNQTNKVINNLNRSSISERSLQLLESLKEDFESNTESLMNFDRDTAVSELDSTYNSKDDLIQESLITQEANIELNEIKKNTDEILLSDHIQVNQVNPADNESAGTPKLGSPNDSQQDIILDVQPNSPNHDFSSLTNTHQDQFTLNQDKDTLVHMSFNEENINENQINNNNEIKKVDSENKRYSDKQEQESIEVNKITNSGDLLDFKQIEFDKMAYKSIDSEEDFYSKQQQKIDLNTPCSDPAIIQDIPQFDHHQNIIEINFIDQDNNKNNK